jgi:hypothetical protein
MSETMIKPTNINDMGNGRFQVTYLIKHDETSCKFVHLVFVVDWSGSMGNLSSLCEKEASALIPYCTGGASLVRFSESAKFEGFYSGSRNWDRVPRMEQNNTDLTSGLRLGVDQIIDREKKNQSNGIKTHHLMVFLSDGEHNSRRENTNDALLAIPSIAFNLKKQFPDIELTFLPIGVGTSSSTKYGMVAQRELQTVGITGLPPYFYAESPEMVTSTIQEVVSCLQKTRSTFTVSAPCEGFMMSAVGHSKSTISLCGEHGTLVSVLWLGDPSVFGVPVESYDIDGASEIIQNLISDARSKKISEANHAELERVQAVINDMIMLHELKIIELNSAAEAKSAAEHVAVPFTSKMSSAERIKFICGLKREKPSAITDVFNLREQFNWLCQFVVGRNTTSADQAKFLTMNGMKTNNAATALKLAAKHAVKAPSFTDFMIKVKEALEVPFSPEEKVYITYAPRSAWSLETLPEMIESWIPAAAAVIDNRKPIDEVMLFTLPGIGITLDEQAFSQSVTQLEPFGGLYVSSVSCTLVDSGSMMAAKESKNEAMLKLPGGGVVHTFFCPVPDPVFGKLSKLMMRSPFFNRTFEAFYLGAFDMYVPGIYQALITHVMAALMRGPVAQRQNKIKNMEADLLREVGDIPAVICPNRHCGLGPYFNRNCAMLGTHHGDAIAGSNEKVSNACGGCGFYADHMSGWKKWDRKLPVSCYPEMSDHKPLTTQNAKLFSDFIWALNATWQRSARDILKETSGGKFTANILKNPLKLALACVTLGVEMSENDIQHLLDETISRHLITHLKTTHYGIDDGMLRSYGQTFADRILGIPGNTQVPTDFDAEEPPFVVNGQPNFQSYSGLDPNWVRIKLEDILNIIELSRRVKSVCDSYDEVPEEDRIGLILKDLEAGNPEKLMEAICSKPFIPPFIEDDRCWAMLAQGLYHLQADKRRREDVDGNVIWSLPVANMDYVYSVIPERERAIYLQRLAPKNAYLNAQGNARLTVEARAPNPAGYLRQINSVGSLNSIECERYHTLRKAAFTHPEKLYAFAEKVILPVREGKRFQMPNYTKGIDLKDERVRNAIRGFYIMIKR